MPNSLLLGALLAALIVLAALATRSLTPGGALAAWVVGTLVFAYGGFMMAILLIFFFTSSSLLSRLGQPKKQAVQADFSKGSRRDAAQVLANGGAAAALVSLGMALPGQSWPWAAASAAIAAATADTWATELGVLSPAEPVHILTRKGVPRGTSGALSWFGSVASAAGSAVIAALAVLLAPWLLSVASRIPWSPPYAAAGLSATPPLGLFIIITLAGFAGNLIDSLLGATLQAQYYCPACEKETERTPQHGCGTPTQPLRGLRWLSNDLVNLACTLSAAGLTALAVWVV